MIVAIPEPDDIVWKLSSEKIPHMTVLFLGEPPDSESAQHVVDYMQHTADTSLTRFGLPVDRRGVLGSEDADVLFFEGPHSYGDMRKIEETRSYLLKDSVISKLHSEAEQHPEWIPHLTMGYPATPAKPDNRDYPGVHWVNFGSLALWTADYEGFDVLLKNDNRSLEVGMADPVDHFLAHFGVKGMKWGVRKQGPSAGGSSAPSKPAPKKASAPEGKPVVGKGGRITAAPKAKGAASSKKDEMSDEELRKAISRIDMERKFAQLTAPPPSKTSAASKFVADLLVDVGKTQVKALLNGAATKQLVKQGLAPAPKANK